MLQNDITDRALERVHCSVCPHCASLSHVVFTVLNHSVILILTISKSQSDHNPHITTFQSQSVLRMEICTFLCLAGNRSCSLKSCWGTEDFKGQNDKKSRRGAERSHLF